MLNNCYLFKKLNIFVNYIYETNFNFMINNYDSVVACNSSGATIYQKQEGTSHTPTKRTWLSFVTVFVALFSFVFVQGQSLSNYAFATGTNGTLYDLTSGSTSYLSGVNDDVSGTVQSLGFDFTFMGTTYSHFSANSNGQMRLHTSSTATAIGTNVSTSAGAAILAPFTGDNEVNNGMRFTITGSAPNRTFVLEWNEFYVNFVNLTNAGNMQVWLEESTGKITYIYGAIFNSSTSSQTRSISISSSNTVTTVGSITIGSTPSFTVGSTLVSNTIAAGANPLGVTPIANIGSLTEGNRRFFSFTPASTVEAPTILTFSGVTSAGTTLNWEDNSTTEYGFLVTRATDAGFTSGLVTSTVASLSAAQTGQAYTSVQTGLLPSTTYYYKVQALSEAVISSDINGSQATNAPGTFISVVTGNFGTAATWDANAVPTQYDSVTIDTGHTVTIDATGQAATNVIVKGTLAYGATPTSFAVNGNLTVDAGALVNVFNGTTGKTLTVAGNITNNGTMDFSVGGANNSSTGASFLVLNGNIVQTVGGLGSFVNNKIGSLTCSNTNTASPNIVWQFDNLVIQHGLNLSGARFDLGTLTLSHGSSFNTTTGSMSLTTSAGCGFMPGAKYRRWFTTGATGGGIIAGQDPTSTSSRYPFVNVTGTSQRWVHIQRSSSSTAGNTAGYLAVKYIDDTTTSSGLLITDGAYTITDRYNANWTITAESGYVYASGTHNIAIVANNAFFPSNGNTRLMLAAAPFEGTHQNGTITPGAQRIGLTTAQLTAGDIYMGINATDIPFISVANGDWETASTWNKNAIPTASDVVYIANNTSVTVNATAAVSNAMTIYAGGTLNVAGSSLDVTTSVTNNGTLNISGGAMSTTTNVTNGASSTITISGTGALTVGTTIANNGTINTNSGNLTVTGGSATGISNSSTGTFVVAGGTVRQGPVGGGNTTFSNSGILTVSSGTLNINGSLSHSGSQFNQSGGNIIIDGNAAGVSINSVASGTSILSLTTSNINWAGGVLTVVDPHANSTASNTLSYSVSTNNVNVSNTHTLALGDGISTDAGGNSTNGFRLNTWVSTGRISFGNVILNTLSGTNRFVSTTYSFGISGDLTINSDSEFRDNGSSISIAGNITNNGVYLATSTLNLANFLNGTASATTNAQTISGTGVFKNLATAETANLTNLTINNSNATGVTLNVPLSVRGTLTMTSGIINTTNTNLLTLGTATAAGTLSGTPSATNMIKGPFARTIASGNTNSSYVLFPVGKTAYAPVSIAPATTAVTVMKAEVFDSNTGTQNAAIVNMTTSRRWEAPIVSGTVTDVNVRLGDAGILASSIPVQAPTAAGEYTNSFGSVATAVAGTTTQSNTAVTSANYTGFLSYADSNACSGTPAPGNTIASTNAICLGTSVTLSLQNVTSGTGVTYQWKSSTDGVTYTAIAGETNATLTLTPTASLYYVCDVTCSAGPSTGTSTAVQITFANSVTTTTPGTRCGEGTVDLSATPSAGASIKWYASEIGGTTIGSGATFTTPSITATTTFYAGSETFSAGSITSGTGTALTSTTSQNSVFCNYWYQGWRQMVFTATELQALGLGAGDITSLTFRVNTLPSPATVNNFAIRMGTTTNTTLTTYQTTGLTEVRPAANYTPTIGLNTFTLATPFIWDGISNVIIDIREDGQYGSSNSATFVTTTATNTVLHSFSSTNNSNYYTSNPTPTASNTRPNVVFAGQVACQSARVPVVATVTPPPALTLSATSATICESESTPVITVTSTVGDYDTYVWSPALGVTGNETTGWTFNPSVSTNYTLTATQTGGSLCSTTANFAVNVNARPTAISLSPVSPVSACENTAVAITATGGTFNSDLFIETMNTLPANFSVVNTAGSGSATLNTTYYSEGTGSVLFNTASTSANVSYQLNSNVDLTGSTSASIVFSHIAAMEGPTTSYDYGIVEFSSDGGSTWNLIPIANYSGSANAAVFNANIRFSTRSYSDWTSTFTSSSSTPGSGPATALWKTETINVPATALSSNQFRIRFRYTTDSSTNYYGWLIDNVKIIKSSNNITWNPVTDLYTDAAATSPYTLGTSAPTVYVKSSMAGTTTYTATSTAVNTGCTISANVNVTVNALPSVVTVNPSAVCSPATVDLTTAAVTSGSDTGLTFSYWTDSAATTSLTTANAVTTSGTYYIKGTNANGCSVVTPVTVTVNPLPVLTVTDPATVCSPATVDITATAVTSGSDTGLTLSYWTDSAATTALTTANAITTSGTYYIKAENTNGCEKIMPVTVTINVTSAPSGDATQTFCGTANITQLVVTGTGVKWYDAATGGNLLPSITAIGLTNGTTYYASQTINSCESTERFAVTVVVNSIPSAPNATAQDFCSAPTVSQLLPIGSTINWYEVETGGTPLASSAVLTANTYYVSQTVNGCESPRTAVNITITALSTPTGNTTQTVFGGVAADATIEDISVNGVNVVWYPTAADAAAGTNAIAAGTQLTDGATYYAVSVIGSCRSAALAVTVTVVLDNPNFDIKALRYYPNPVVDVLTISYTNAITTVQVYDISGRLVRDMQPNSKDVTVDLSNLAASVYVVKVFADTTSSEFKVVKK